MIGCAGSSRGNPRAEANFFWTGQIGQIPKAVAYRKFGLKPRRFTTAFLDL
jgi:hypothetical protein